MSDDIAVTPRQVEPPKVDLSEVRGAFEKYTTVHLNERESTVIRLKSSTGATPTPT